jgi:hypothetical protein
MTNLIINKEFEPKTFDEKMSECSLDRIQDKNSKKWNLERKTDGTIISEIWFDNLGTWSTFSRIKNKEIDIFGWEGLLFLERPVKTPKSAYPYSVRAKCFHYSSEGELIKITETVCGIYEL